jgi:hypothetical protein
MNNRTTKLALALLLAKWPPDWSSRGANVWPL